MIEEVHGKIWFIGKRGRLGKCKRSSSRVWEEDEYRNEVTREVGYSWRKRL